MGRPRVPEDQQKISRLEYQRNYRKTKKAKTDCSTRLYGLRAWLKEIKNSLACYFCKESTPICLDFHHKDQKTKSFTITTGVSSGYSKEKILEEMAKCVVVCANCHRKIHSKLLFL